MVENLGHEHSAFSQDSIAVTEDSQILLNRGRGRRNKSRGPIIAPTEETPAQGSAKGGIQLVVSEATHVAEIAADCFENRSPLGSSL